MLRCQESWQRCHIWFWGVGCPVAVDDIGGRQSKLTWLASEKHSEEKHLAPRNDRPVHPSWSQEGEGLTKGVTFALYPIILPKGTGACMSLMKFFIFPITCMPRALVLHNLGFFFFFKERLAHGVKQCTNVSCLLVPNASLVPNPNSPRASEANFIIAAEIQQLSDVGRLGPCQWLPAGPEGFPGAKFWSLCIHRWKQISQMPKKIGRSRVYKQPTLQASAKYWGFLKMLLFYPRCLARLKTESHRNRPWAKKEAANSNSKTDFCLIGASKLKGSYSQCFFSSHVQMWDLDHKESWAPKNWCFWTVVLEKTLESPLDCKEIKPVNPKGNQPWIFIWRTDAEADTSILWTLDGKSWLTGKDSDAGKDRRQEEKGMTEDELVG